MSEPPPLLRNLPPLEAGTAYRAEEVDYFEYVGSPLTGSEASLRLHHKDGITIDLPASDADLKMLMCTLIEVFPSEAASFMKSRSWSK